MLIDIVIKWSIPRNTYVMVKYYFVRFWRWVLLSLQCKEC